MVPKYYSVQFKQFLVKCLKAGTFSGHFIWVLKGNPTTLNTELYIIGVRDAECSITSKMSIFRNTCILTQSNELIK